MFGKIFLLSVGMVGLMVVIDILTITLLIYISKYIVCPNYIMNVLFILIIMIAFSSIYIQIILWAAIVYIINSGAVTFEDSMIYASDAFSTLGATGPPNSPWVGLGAYIAISGILSMTILTSTLFYIFQKAFTRLF